MSYVVRHSTPECRTWSEVHEVDLAATLRRLGRASDVLVVLLVAAAPRVAAVRGEAAVLDLGALRHRRVERDDVVLGGPCTCVTFRAALGWFPCETT